MAYAGVMKFGDLGLMNFLKSQESFFTHRLLMVVKVRYKIQIEFLEFLPLFRDPHLGSLAFQ
jgi:hypothetical protein